MDENKMIELLRLYRHDLVNDLQVAEGYAALGKYDKAHHKLKVCMEKFKQERKLTSLGAPEFALWLIYFHANHENIRITYQMNNETNLHLGNIDTILTNKCQTAIEIMEQCINKDELYVGALDLSYTGDTIDIAISVCGQIQSMPDISGEIKNGLEFKGNGKGITCNLSIPFD